MATGGLDDETARSHDPLDDGLVIGHVLHTPDRDLPTGPPQHTGSVDDPLRGDDESGSAPTDVASTEVDDRDDGDAEPGPPSDSWCIRPQHD